MKITPFGDNQSHGALGNSVIYVRRRGINYVKIFKSPKNPNTSAQQDQRALFQDAVIAWQALTGPEKDIWRAKASGLSPTGYNLFIKDYLLNPPAPVFPLMMKHITGMTITTPRSTDPHGWRHALFWQSTGKYFYVWDNNQDIFDRGEIPSSMQIRYQSLGGSQTMNVQAGDSIVVTHDMTPSPITIYLPAFTGTVYLFPATSGATYWDIGLTMLAQGPP